MMVAAQPMTLGKRLRLYIVIWLGVATIVLAIRFTTLRYVSADERLMLVIAYLLLVGVLLATSKTYESRRLILRSGWRGRGLFGYIRGWIKTTNVEFAADTPSVNREGERELLIFNRVATWLFMSSVIIGAVVLF